MLGFRDGRVLIYSQLDSIPVDGITRWEAEFRAHLTGTQSALLEKIASGNVTPETENEIKKVCFYIGASLTRILQKPGRRRACGVFHQRLVRLKNDIISLSFILFYIAARLRAMNSNF